MYIDKPEVKSTFFYGEIVSWKTPNTLKKDRDKYCVTIELTFKSGKTISKQYGTCITAAEARKAIDTISGKLFNKRFVPFKYTCNEFFDYWFYWNKIDEISYNTFFTYRNAIYNYILPAIGNVYVNDLKSSDIISLVESLNLNTSKFKVIKGVLYAAFKFARINNIVEVNPIPSAMRILTSKHKKSNNPKDQIEVYSPHQILRLLDAARNYKNLFIPVLLAATAGLRISESLAIRKQDIDFNNGILHVTHQIGSEIEDGKRMTKLISPKTYKGVRDIPLSEDTLHELSLAIKRNELYFEKHPSLVDQGFITINDDGFPYSRSQIYRSYHSAVEDAHLPFLHYHSLRHAYATILEKSSGNLKVIAETMGHSSSKTTDEIYVYKEKNVTDASNIMNSFIASLNLDEEQCGDKVYDSSQIINKLLSDIGIKN